MADKEYEAEGEQDHISKLAFTVLDLDQYIPKGAPATRKEVLSYYAYVSRFRFD
jgi:hypothetical protein